MQGKRDESLQRSLVGIRVGPVEYALPTAAVRAIRLPGRITPLPRLPEGVLGVYEYRGRVIPILDLRICFDAPADGNDRPKWLILESGRGLVGLVVDQVTGVFDCGPKGLGPIPPLGVRPQTCHVAGVAHHEANLTFVLDLVSFHTAALCLDQCGPESAAGQTPGGATSDGNLALPPVRQTIAVDVPHLKHSEHGRGP